MNTPVQNAQSLGKKLPFLFISAMLLFGALASGFLSSVTQNGIGAILAFLCYLIFCAYLSQRAPASFILLSPMLFLRASEIYAGIPIEYGSYMEEITTYGTPSGSTGRLVAFYIFCFYICTLIIQPFWRKIKEEYYSNYKNHRVNNYIFLGFAAVVLAGTAYMIVFGITNGFPLIEDYDRFTYAREHETVIYTQWMQGRYVMAFLLGVFYTSRKHRFLTIAIAVTILATSILFAEKFTSISLILIIITMPSALLYIARHNKLPLRQIVMYPAIILSITLPLVFVVYGGLENDKSALEGLMSRMASQGQLWYVIDDRYSSFANVKYDVLAKDFATWFDLSKQDARYMGTDIGLYHVMDYVAPAEVTKGQVERGTGYVFSLFPYIMMISGWMGLIILGPLTHIVFTALMLSILYQFTKKNYLNLILCARLFVMIFSGGFVVGYLWYFFGVKTLIYFGLILMIDSIMRIATIRRPPTPRARAASVGSSPPRS